MHSPNYDSISAERQKRCRHKAHEEFGLQSYTHLWTPAEEGQMRKQFRRLFGHDWTLTDRKENAARKTASAALATNPEAESLRAKETPNAQPEQLALFN